MLKDNGERGWSYARLARETGLSEYGLNKLLNGKVPNPRLSTINAVLRALDMETIDIQK